MSILAAWLLLFVHENMHMASPHTTLICLASNWPSSTVFNQRNHNICVAAAAADQHRLGRSFTKFDRKRLERGEWLLGAGLHLQVRKA